jgi:hypothetical protein
VGIRLYLLFFIFLICGCDSNLSHKLKESYATIGCLNGSIKTKNLLNHKLTESQILLLETYCKQSSHKLVEKYGH